MEGISAENKLKIESIKQKYAVVKQFLGIKSNSLYLTDWSDLDTLIKAIEDDYASIQKYVYQELIWQTRFKPYLQKIYLFSDEQENLYIDYANLIEKFILIQKDNPEKAFIDLAEFLYYAEIDSQHVLSKLFADMLSQAQDSGKINYYFDILGDEIVEALIEREIIDNNEIISTPENDSDNFAAENPDYAEDLSIELSEEQNYNALQEDDSHIFSSEHEIDEISAEDNAENSDLLNLLDIDDADLSFIASSKDFILSLAENIDQSLESELFDNYLIDQEINSEQITAFIASLGDYFSYENGAEKAEILQINFEII